MRDHLRTMGVKELCKRCKKLYKESIRWERKAEYCDDPKLRELYIEHSREVDYFIRIVEDEIFNRCRTCKNYRQYLESLYM